MTVRLTCRISGWWHEGWRTSFSMEHYPGSMIIYEVQRKGSRRQLSLPLLRGRLAMSDETLVDVAPSPLRPRLQAGGERVVGLLVVRPGVPVR